MHKEFQNRLIQINKTKPLVLNLTNFVTMDFVANGLLSLGASPIMCCAEQELEDLMQLADVLVINLGTLNSDFVKLCDKACQLANRNNKPIILDPVGAGASRYRTEMNSVLMHRYPIAIIKGNASEIMALNEIEYGCKGVDSVAASAIAIESAKQLSNKSDTTIVISGIEDHIVHYQEVTTLHHGSKLMTTVTGAGCLLTAVIAAFHAVEKNAMHAAVMATLYYGLCAEVAAEQASGPGSFRTHLIDTLHNLFKENLS